MFFVISVNPKKLTVRIVGNAITVEEAINIVSERADDYVKSMNDPIMHRGPEDMSFTDRIIYFTRKSPDHDYQIDVFRQQTRPHKGWTGTSYKDEETLVRRFIYTEYGQTIPDAPPPMPTTTTTTTEDENKTARIARTKAMNLTVTNTIGGFPSSILTSLQENERFKQSRLEADRNRLPPSFKTTILEDFDEDST